MAEHSWYTRTTWTSDDREQFLTRLARVRSDHDKAQRALIQVESLLPNSVEDAAAVLEIARGHVGKSTQAHLHYLDACVQLARGALEEAFLHFERAFEAEDAYPSYLSPSAEHYAVVAAENNLPERCAVAVRRIQMQHLHTTQASRYAYHSALAILERHRGDTVTAAAHAQQALRHAAATSSGLRYHPNVGLVSAQPARLRSTLTGLASSAPRNPRWGVFVAAQPTSLVLSKVRKALSLSLAEIAEVRCRMPGEIATGTFEEVDALVVKLFRVGVDAHHRAV